MNPINTNGISSAPRVETDRKSDGVKVDGGKVDSGLGRTAEQPPLGLGDDTVALTDTASKLGALQAEVAAAPGVDLARVEAIRARIAEGSYQVEPDRIADALVQLERDLL